MSILDRIVASKRSEVERLRGRAAELRRAAESAPQPGDFAAALRRSGEVAVIAELKRRSPSAGVIRPAASASVLARAYEAGGAAALSVVTDAEFFGGSLSDLGEARAAAGLPVLRKDFVLDAVQLYETRAAGSDAVLLIARLLADAQLGELLALAAELRLTPLVEVHDALELERALAMGARLIGINNRDLATFRTELAVTLTLAEQVPAERVLVAESGIASAADVDRLGAAGVDAVLVGETLASAPDPAAATRALVGRARRGRRVVARSS